MSSKIALPKPKKKGKWAALVLLGIGLCFVLTDPLGSSEAVKHVFANVSTFVVHLKSGGGR